MIKFPLVLLYLLGFCNNSIAQTDRFSLEGITSNIEDGTYLYLRDLVSGENIDSALVQNNNFKFTTDLSAPAIFSVLFTKDRKNFKELWLVNKEMTFNSSNGNFKDAIVTGSKNQDLFDKVNNEVHSGITEASPDTISKREIGFIKDHPNSLVSAYLLYGNRVMNQNEIRELFYILSNEVQESSLGKKIAANLKKDIIEPGGKYADFKLPDTDGNLQKLSELTGKLTLLQFWSSTCNGSRMMNSTLNDLYKKYHSKGFNIISISKDEVKENWIAAIDEDNLSWPQLSNLKGWDGEVFKAYGISSTPSNVLINENGIIIGKNIMGNDLEDEIVDHLE